MPAEQLEKRGSVDKGDTITDSMDIENVEELLFGLLRHLLFWNGVKCNIIDTPGTHGFYCRGGRTFKMLDGTVPIIIGKGRHTSTNKVAVQDFAKLQNPTIIFINKIDRAGVNLSVCIWI